MGTVMNGGGMPPMQGMPGMMAGMQPQAAGQEHTPSDPMTGTAQDPQNNGNISEDDQKRLIALVRRYKDQWSQDRIVLTQRCTRNLEMFKGNANVVFGPGTTSFNTTDWINSVAGGSEHAQDADDDSLYDDCLNFFQMLCIAFIAALSPQLPKSKWRPEDADQLIDLATAKAAQLVIDLVERNNHEVSLYKAQLLYLYNCGAAFRDTRWVVSADRGGTKTEPVFETTDTEMLPARYHCFNCGMDNAAEGLMPNMPCAGCNQQMGGDSFYPPVTGPMTQQVGTQKVPIGIVAQNIYSPLEVDVDPRAETIRETPILNLEYEVHIAALRAAYPDMYDQIIASATSELSTNGSQDRIARQQVYSQTDGQSSILSDQRPTLSKSWIQAWAFDLEDDREFGKRMRIAFPTGCLVVSSGPTCLSSSESDVNKRWTVARTHEKFGMYPTCPGDVVRPFQLRYNNLGNIMQDAIERCAIGITLANNDLIDSKSFEGKRLLPGVLTGVKLKRTGAPGAASLQDALFQFKFALEIAELMEYQRSLMFSAQTFAGVQPQTYGGAGDPNVQTLGGQQQQLNTALGTMGTYWNNLQEEHASADELAVECAKANLTEDLKYAIEEKGSEFRNQYVRLDDLQGSVHAYSDIDQGLPVSASELRERLMNLVQMAGSNPLVAALFEDPENQEQAVDSIGIPNLVVPGGAMRTKVLQIIDQLLKSGPVPRTDPATGAVVGLMPTVMPNPLVDNFDISRAVVKLYCQQNYDVETRNPNGFKNLLAYLEAMSAAETEQASQQEVMKGKAALAGHLASQPPPAPKPQLPPQEQMLQQVLRQVAVPALQNQLRIGGGDTPQGQSANADILGLVAGMEKLASDAQASV